MFLEIILGLVSAYATASIIVGAVATWLIYNLGSGLSGGAHGYSLLEALKVGAFMAVVWPYLLLLTLEEAARKNLRKRQFKAYGINARRFVTKGNMPPNALQVNVQIWAYAVIRAACEKTGGDLAGLTKTHYEELHGFLEYVSLYSEEFMDRNALTMALIKATICMGSIVPESLEALNQTAQAMFGDVKTTAQVIAQTDPYWDQHVAPSPSTQKS